MTHTALLIFSAEIRTAESQSHWLKASHRILLLIVMINNFASLLYKTIQLTWTVAGIWLLFWQSWSVNITDLVLPVSTLTAKKNILRFFFFIITSDKNPNNLHIFNFDVLPNKPFLKVRKGLIAVLQASRAPELRKSIHTLPNWVTVRPYHRHTNVK